MFIVFEGIDGSGKTTIIKQVVKLLKKIPKYRKNIIFTREPGGTIIGEEIREIILKNYQKKIDNITETLLYAASRRQHIVEKIKPNLKNKIILCDRFIDSSFVYQGFIRGVDIEKIIKINSFATENIKPDITFVFDIDPKLSLKRIAKRHKKNHFDLEKISFHQKARQAFLKICKNKNHILIKADEKISQIANKIYQKIIKILEK